MAMLNNQMVIFLRGVGQPPTSQPEGDFSGCQMAMPLQSAASGEWKIASDFLTWLLRMPYEAYYMVISPCKDWDA